MAQRVDTSNKRALARRHLGGLIEQGEYAEMPTPAHFISRQIGIVGGNFEQAAGGAVD
jgi:hypothetical protein